MKKKLSEITKLLVENADGSLDGGFKLVSLNDNATIIGGTETNNCNGGNCVQGCGGPTNNVKFCGPPS